MVDEHDVKAQEIVAQTSPYRMSADDIACLNITKAIAAALREAVAAERKRCAEVARRHDSADNTMSSVMASVIALAIEYGD
jgi:hypothetical protein